MLRRRAFTGPQHRRAVHSAGLSSTGRDPRVRPLGRGGLVLSCHRRDLHDLGPRVGPVDGVAAVPKSPSLSVIADRGDDVSGNGARLSAGL